ncbi:MAG TPA: 4Fe-4S dicluster domain-containing protein [Sedimentisphaerales bacterium]|jgi:NAD-dependent dihydropyrimidine dehydrogenase PreA subunit|nr:4Fe-4S dicluster domain-containing protein [Sedimentisphaerales bacterium]HNU27835.1 4Fe-4S dicluster domain-containing protein [Sedimentisphaerales bacterium]
MTEGRPAGQQLVLVCNCVHYDVISRATKTEVLRLLSESGARVQVVADLCGLAANRDLRLRDWASSASLSIVACFPRAVRWLFHAAGVSLSHERVRFFNMRTQSPDEITRELMKDDGLLMIEGKSVSSASNRQSSIINHQSPWVPWFPVIDYDRCVNCKQCMNFCLFGVYGLSEEGQVTVQKPSGCKTNCPACARMCPRKAIIFPKYADPPINGDECLDPTTGQEKPVVAGDVYERIRSRSAAGKRFSTEPGDAGRSCPTLDGLRRDLDIPDEVLASLSREEMQRVIRQSKSPSGGGKGDKRDE